MPKALRPSSRSSPLNAEHRECAAPPDASTASGWSAVRVRPGRGDRRSWSRASLVEATTTAPTPGSPPSARSRARLHPQDPDGRAGWSSDVLTISDVHRFLQAGLVSGSADLGAGTRPDQSARTPESLLPWPLLAKLNLIVAVARMTEQRLRDLAEDRAGQHRRRGARPRADERRRRRL
ncbi:hypothetical protein HBB16_08610 [Pseudonocardia sp. MCCB 268]|nr:hypothetical protein [Pseudonocardia cytotoxica]